MGILTGGQVIGGAQAPSKVFSAILGSPGAADTNYIVESANMKVGAYTLAHASMPSGIPRNVTVSQTAVDTEDTNGTIVVVGTDANGVPISETITPNAGATVAGAKAFKTITSVTGAGWVVDAVQATPDTVIVGYGEVLGLPVCLSRDSVVSAFLDGVRESTRPTVAVDADDVCSNTVDLNSALNGTEVIVDYYDS